VKPRARRTLEALRLALSVSAASAACRAIGHIEDEKPDAVDWLLDHYDPNPHDAYGFEYPYVPKSRAKIEYDPPWPWKSDRVLRADVHHHLTVTRFVNDENIQVSVKDGVVTLDGRVDDLQEISNAIASAYEAGAKNVVSRLEARHVDD
jgi:hypothetical protein